MTLCSSSGDGDSIYSACEHKVRIGNDNPAGMLIRTHHFESGTAMFETTILVDEQFLEIVGPLNARVVSTPSDLRKFPRFAVQLDVKCQGLDEQWLPVGVPFKGAAMNISRGGIMFSTDAITDAPLVRLELLRGYDVLAECTMKVVRRGAGTLAGPFVKRA